MEQCIVDELLRKIGVQLKEIPHKTGSGDIDISFTVEITPTKEFVN